MSTTVCFISKRNCRCIFFNDILVNPLLVNGPTNKSLIPMMFQCAIAQKYLLRVEQSNSGSICSCPQTIVFVHKITIHWRKRLSYGSETKHNKLWKWKVSIGKKTMLQALSLLVEVRSEVCNSSKCLYRETLILNQSNGASSFPTKSTLSEANNRNWKKRVLQIRVKPQLMNSSVFAESPKLSPYWLFRTR